MEETGGGGLLGGSVCLGALIQQSNICGRDHFSKDGKEKMRRRRRRGGCKER